MIACSSSGWKNRKASAEGSSYPTAPKVELLEDGHLIHRSAFGMMTPFLGARMPSESLSHQAMRRQKTIVANDYVLNPQFRQFSTVRANVRSLVVTGTMTDICVLATVVGAFNHEYRVTVVEDGVATLWPEIQRATLDIIRRAYGRVVRAKVVTDEIAAW